MSPADHSMSPKHLRGMRLMYAPMVSAMSVYHCRGAALLQMLCGYAERFSALLEGHSEDMPLSELMGGARIRHIFQVGCSGPPSLCCTDLCCYHLMSLLLKPMTCSLVVGTCLWLLCSCCQLCTNASLLKTINMYYLSAIKQHDFNTAGLALSPLMFTQEVFGRQLRSLDPFRELGDEDVRTAIKNSSGVAGRRDVTVFVFTWCFWHRYSHSLHEPVLLLCCRGSECVTPVPANCMHQLGW